MPKRKTVRRRAIRRKTRRGGSYTPLEGLSAYEQQAYNNAVRQTEAETAADAKIQGMTKIMELLANSRTLLRNRDTRQMILHAIDTYNTYLSGYSGNLLDKVVEDFQAAFIKLSGRIESMNAENN